MVKPVGVLSPIADPWESGRPVKELCWQGSQVTREGFAEVSSAKKKGGSRSLKVGSGRILDTGQGYLLLQIRVRPIVILARFDQYLGKRERKRDQEVGQVYSCVRDNEGDFCTDVLLRVLNTRSVRNCCYCLFLNEV